MKFRLCFCLALLAICFAPIAVGQQVYQPMAGMPAVLPQQAPYGAYQGAPNMMPAHQAVGYNMPMVGSFQPTVQGCDSCDTCVGCDSNGCDVGSCCCGQLYDPCCPNVYVSVYGGGSDFENGYILGAQQAMAWESVVTFPGGGAIGSGQINYGTHEEFGLGMALGRTLGRRFRAELDFTWRRGQANSLENLAPPFNQVAAEGQVNIYSLMPNLLVDLNPNGRVNVYGGAGGGIAFVNTDITQFGPGWTGLGLQQYNSSFAYQGIAGISARISCRAEVFFEYRYFSTDNFRAAGMNAIDQQVYLEETFFGMSELVSHDYFVGVRISRW